MYLNNADNTFSAAITTTGFANVSNGIFAGQAGNQQGWLANVDNDPNLDYVFSGDDDNIHVFSGNGDGTFSTTAVTTSLSDTPSTYGTSGIGGFEYFELIDVNNDGKADLVGGTDNSSGYLTVWLASSGGNFNSTPAFTASITDSGATNTAGRTGSEYSQFIDINGDGNVDYVHTESSFDEEIWVFLGDGLGNFDTSGTGTKTTITDAPLGGGARFANFTNARQSFFYDLDADGYPEYITTGDDGVSGNIGISVYSGNSNAIFTNTVSTTNITSGFATGSGTTETTYVIANMLFSPSQIVLNQIGKEGDNPDSVNSVVTTAQLALIEPTVNNIVTANEAAYQDYIDANPDEFSEPATQAEVQAMVNAVNASQTVLAQIGTEAGSGSSDVTIAELQSITPEVTGIVPANEAAYQAYIAANAGAFSSPATQAEVQDMIDAVNDSQTVLAQIGTEAGSGSSLVDISDLLTIVPELTDIVPANESAYQAYIAGNADAFSSPATQAEVQDMIDEVNSVAVTVASSATNSLTQQELTDAGITQTGLSAAQLEAIEIAINAANPKPVSTSELQALVDTALSTLSILDVEKADEIKLFPNPTYGEVRLQQTVNTIVVYNTVGKEVLKLQNANSFDLTNLQSGVYYVNITNSKGFSSVSKIVKR